MLTALRLGMDFALAARRATLPNPDIVAQAEGLGRRLRRVAPDHARSAAKPWTARTRSTPTSGPAWARSRKPWSARRAFHEYQVNEELFEQARPDAVFMHCLPAKRGEEVTDGVMESPRSVVFDQAENRLHAQKALLLMMLTRKIYEQSKKWSSRR